MKTIMGFDKYTREARFYPAVATLPPFILLNYFYLQTYLSGFVNTLLGLVVGVVSMSIVFIFLLMEANRFISKMILEKRYFNDELMMPTTNFLLFKDGTYSEDQKNRIRKKIYEDFAIALPSQHEENTNERSARQKIAEAVSQVRAKMKGGRLILQHNIHYGAARNLIGGSFIALTVSLLDVFVFMTLSPNHTAATVSLVFVLFYGTLIALSKYILSALGKSYARVLFQEYLSS